MPGAVVKFQNLKGRGAGLPIPRVIKEDARMNRTEIAKKIAENLLDIGALDENNFSDDTDALLDCTEKVILKHLEDFILLQGRII